jgi:hypothetical protein
VVVRRRGLGQLGSGMALLILVRALVRLVPVPGSFVCLLH